MSSARPAAQNADSVPIVGDALTVSFIAAISTLAQVSGIALLLFPELGALSYDVFRRPDGAWAKAPVMLVATPFLTGFVGTLTVRNLAYGPLSVLITVMSAMVIIRVLRSPVAPAISAGLLPLTLGETGWWYAPLLLVGSGLLALSSMIWRRLRPLPAEAAPPDGHEIPPETLAEKDFAWLPFFAVFLAAGAYIGTEMGMRFLLCPPLAVVAFEMFAHRKKCAWAMRPLLVPVICCLSATAAFLLVAWLGVGPLAAALSVTCGVVLMRVFKLHFPPAITVGLLPFVMPHLDGRYPAAVTLGAVLLCLAFLLWRKTSAWSRARH